MKKRKLKKFVLPTLYLLILGVMAASITFLSKNLLERNVSNDEHYNYTMSVFNDTDEDTSKEETETTIIAKPFASENVTIAKEFYNKEESKENQEKALIYYEGTYMPNTGILYESEEAFEVMAILDGTIKDIKQDEILGNVITVEHEKNITTIYYTLGEIKVKVGDKVTQNQVLATSGSSKLETSKSNTLLFETYINGNVVNPNNVLEKNISDFN